ncbi:hypothetical protein [Micromonospora sp. NPDC048898]|uniref:hypothetical protein n=1 Tax=Micromonospora sp. NPDC048898 TaxID=3364260 RepID=UPI003716392C
MTAGLPFVDEHRMDVVASPDRVWRALTTQVAGPRFAASEAIARLLAADPPRSSRTPLEQDGATLTGFRVAEAVPGRILRLTGRHRFSRYSLVLTLTEGAGCTVVSARTYAAFPGLHGFVYRALVISSGAHHLAVRRLLHLIRMDAEAGSA